MSEPTLLPCPFCGSNAQLERNGDHHGEFFTLGCSDEACHASHQFYTELAENEAECVRAWNRRAAPAEVEQQERAVIENDQKEWDAFFDAKEALFDASARCKTADAGHATDATTGNAAAASLQTAEPEERCKDCGETASDHISGHCWLGKSAEVERDAARWRELARRFPNEIDDFGKIIDAAIGQDV